MTDMPCCKAAKPDCEHHAASSVKCCKIGDHPDQQPTAKIPVVTTPVRTQIVVDLVIETPALRLLTHTRPNLPIPLFAGTTSPPHLAFSALLI